MNFVKFVVGDEKFVVGDEEEIRGIPQKRIDTLKYDPKCDVLEIKIVED